MNDWIPSACPEYIEKTLTRGAATITIRRPVLSKEEQDRREGKTRAELEGVLCGYYRRKK